MAQPGLDAIAQEARQALKIASGMFQFLSARKDRDGAALAYLALQQLASLLSALPGHDCVSVTVRPHDPDSQEFMIGVLSEAEALSRRDDPAIVTLTKLRKFWQSRYRDVPPPIQPLTDPAQGVDFDGARLISSLRCPPGGKARRR